MNPAKQPQQAVSKGEKILKGVLAGVIAILLVVLAFLLYARFQPYHPSSRAVCIMNIRNFQTGARSYGNLAPDQARPGAAVDATAVDKFMRASPYHCPSGGSYTVQGRYGDPPGTVFLRCSHPDHAPAPAQSANW